MKKIALLLIANLTLLLATADLQIDLDHDGKLDEVSIKKDGKHKRIVYSLSSLNGKTFKSDALESFSSQIQHLRESKNGFKYVETFMRGGVAFQFRYEKRSKKMQLIGMEHHEFGNAGHDGRGESSVNLLTGKYIAQWAYVDYEKDKLITPPQTVRYYKFDKIYLDNFAFMIDKYYALDNGKKDVFILKKRSATIKIFLAKKFPNYKLLEYKNTKINQTKVVVLESKKKGEPYSELDDGFGRKVVLVENDADGFKIIAQNNQILGCSTCGGAGVGDPYRGITVKGKYLSFEELYGGCVKDFQVTTFKYNEKKKRWYLHKLGVESTYCNEEENGEPKMKRSIKTVKSFGVVEFSEFKDGLRWEE